MLVYESPNSHMHTYTPRESLCGKHCRRKQGIRNNNISTGSLGILDTRTPAQPYQALRSKSRKILFLNHNIYGSAKEFGSLIEYHNCSYCSSRQAT